MEIKELIQHIHNQNSDKGFWQDKENPNIPLRLVLIHAEVSEALEALRDNKRADINSFVLRAQEIRMSYMDINKIDLSEEDFITLFKSRIKDSFEDELADVVIRTLDLAAGLNIDIEKHIIQKLKFNKTRPFKHNKPF